MKKAFSCFLVILTGIFIGLISISVSNATEEDLLLKFRPQAGQSFNMMEYYDFQVKLPENQSGSELHTSLGVGYLMKVVQVAENGEVTTQLNIHSLINRTPGAFGQMEIYDSSDPFVIPSRNTFPLSLLVGRTIEIQLNSEGEVTGLNFPEASLNEMLDRLVGKDETLKKNLQEKINRCLTEVTARPTLKMIRGVLPDNPVSVGASWQKNIAAEQNWFPFTEEVTYTLKERQGGIARIEINGQVLIANIPAPDEFHTITQLNGGMTGFIEILEDSGWTLRSDLQLNLTGEIQEKNTYLTDSDEKQSSFSLVGHFLTKPYGE